MSILDGMPGSGSFAGLATGLAVGIVLAVLAFVRMRRGKQKLARRHADLASTNRRNQAIVEASGEGVLELDSVGRVRYANPAAARMLGRDLEELAGLDYRVLINTRADNDTRTDPVLRVRYTTDIMRGVGALLRRKDGQYRPVEYKIVPVNEEGATVATVLAFRDVSERVHLDNLLKDMQATARVGGWEFHVSTARIHWTDAVYAIHDLPVGTAVDRPKSLAFFSPGDATRLSAACDAAIESGTTSDLQLRLTSAKGRKLWTRVIVKAERREGRTTRVHGTYQDVTDRVMAETQVRETRDFYELTLDAMPTMVTYTNRELLITYANKAVEEWLSVPREQLIGSQTRDVPLFEDIPDVSTHMAAALRGETTNTTHTSVRNGRSRDWQTHYVPEIASDGETRGFFAIIYDLTELKRLEARLLQAQKMEAIGQLTGGIAHDFNNLLGIVLGNLQLLERGVAESPALARKVHTAMRAAVRGADLTRRLLSFARRQILDPTVIDLNRQLGGLADLMQRTLGESIEVRIVQGHNLWHTRVDAGQLENAIINLAINARDAMPQGGRLTVKTQNFVVDSLYAGDHPELEPGEYVSISVSDTGSGIEPDVLKRVFEPFFTTKESGKGSGLGLAMVHSFVEQSGGLATIESRMGQGTSVQILLPRCREPQTLREDTIVTRVAPGGSETILVVEDDADLRETVVTALGHLGYRALQAPNAAAALAVLVGTEHIDLLFTDVMMPGGVLGPQLAKRARELRPDIQVLFTTGYAETNSGLTGADVIHKPYRSEELATRIRYVLDWEARVA